MARVEDYESLEVRVGTIVSARPLRGARLPTAALTIDFGALGKKVAAARIQDLYDPLDLIGLQVAAIVNFPPRSVAGLASEVRVLAVDDGKGQNILLIPERPVPDGGKVG